MEISNEIRQFLSANGRIGGKVKSPRKTASGRKNAAKATAAMKLKRQLKTK